MVFKRRAPRAARRPALGVAKRRRVWRKPRIPRTIVPAKLQCKRTFYNGAWQFGTAQTSDYWRYFSYTLGQLPTVTEFTSLFDEYKINAIKVTFRPSYDSVPSDAPALNVNTGPQAYAHIFIDPAQTALPAGVYNSATLNSFLENDKIRTVTANRPFSVYFRPMIRDAVQGTGANAELRRSKYIRSNETGAVYSGFNMFLQQNNFSTSNSRISLDMFVTYYMTFKNMR